MDCSRPGFSVLHYCLESFTIVWSLQKLMSIALAMLSNHLIFCCPRLLLPSIFPSIRVFSIELALWIRWPKRWSFSFSISPSSEYSGVISFGIDWLDLLAVQGTLKSLLHTTVQKHQFFRDQPLKTKGKRETSWTIGGNVNWYSHYGEQYRDSSRN